MRASMGHYREGRPRAWEDRMKGVEVCYSTVKKINNAPFTGFTVWEKGKHIIPPARRYFLRQVKLRADNRGYKPRLGMSMDEDMNHTRMVKAMVARILRQNDPWQRRLNQHNVDMHPAFLRRPLRPSPPRPHPKKRPQWQKSTLTHGRHSPYLTAEERYTRFISRIKCPDIAVSRFRDVPVQIRDGTPVHMTPKPKTKLIDATDGLSNRNLFDFRKSPSKSKSADNKPKDSMNRIGSDDVGMTQIYSKVLDLPDAVSFYTPCPYIKKKKTDTGYERYWFYDMDNKDLPCDLKITPSDHAIDNPIRPISSQLPNLDPFTEPKVLYDEDMVPLDHLPSQMSSPSSFGMHAYGSLPGWAPIGPNDFLEREYESMSTRSASSGTSSPRLRSEHNEATAIMTPVPPWNSATASPLYSTYDPSVSRNLAPNWLSPFYSYDKTNFRNDDGGISKPQSVNRADRSRKDWPTTATLAAGTLGSEMSARFGGLVTSLPPSPGYLTPKSAIFKPELTGEGVDWSSIDSNYSLVGYRPLDDPPWKHHQCCEIPY